VQVFFLDDLIEQWTIVNVHQQALYFRTIVFDELMAELKGLVSDLLRQGHETQELRHTFYFNETDGHRTDWLNPHDLNVRQILKNDPTQTFTVSVAYIPKLLYLKQSPKGR
jgi:hypothetical protein